MIDLPIPERRFHTQWIPTGTRVLNLLTYQLVIVRAFNPYDSAYVIQYPDGNRSQTTIDLLFAAPLTDPHPTPYLAPNFTEKGTLQSCPTCGHYPTYSGWDDDGEFVYSWCDICQAERDLWCCGTHLKWADPTENTTQYGTIVYTYDHTFVVLWQDDTKTTHKYGDPNLEIIA